jgi:hypothetical protein
MIKILHPDGSVSWLNPEHITTISVSHSDAGMFTRITVGNGDVITLQGDRMNALALLFGAVLDRPHFTLDCLDPATSF